MHDYLFVYNRIMLFKIKQFVTSNTHSHLSIAIIIFSPYSLFQSAGSCGDGYESKSLMWPFIQIWFWWTTLGQKCLPCNSKGTERGKMRQTWLHQTGLQPNWHYPLPQIWPLRLCRSLPIPPLGSSGVGHVHSGPSSTLPPWEALQDLELQMDSLFGSLGHESPLPWQGINIYILNRMSEWTVHY